MIFRTFHSHTTKTAITTSSTSVTVTNGASFGWVKVYAPSADVHVSTATPCDTADTVIAAGTVDYFWTDKATTIYSRTVAGTTDLFVTPGDWSNGRR